MKSKDTAVSALGVYKQEESTFRYYQTMVSAQEARTLDLCASTVSEQDPRVAPLHIERKSQFIIFNWLL